MFAGTFAPRGWALCDGQLLPIAQNSALFSILGTNYGGDGRTTFGLPDLRGRVPVGVGNGPGLGNYRQGVKGGSETNVLTNGNLPAGSGANVSGYQVNPKTSADEFKAGGTTVLTVGNAANATVRASSLGAAGHAVNNMQPYTTIHYIICISGTFPSRS
ncbi:MAG: phage tail protein [Aureispira sp.]|nr:phage tail protein [Aureispira sp.]